MKKYPDISRKGFLYYFLNTNLVSLLEIYSKPRFMTEAWKLTKEPMVWENVRKKTQLMAEHGLIERCDPTSSYNIANHKFFKITKKGEQVLFHLKGIVDTLEQ